MALLDMLKKKKTKSIEPRASGAVKGMSAKKQETRKGGGTEIPPKPLKEKKTAREGERFSHIIIRPRITEKASTGSGDNSYTFNVARSANKIEIKKAIKEVYNVSPVKIRIINMKPKRKIVRGILGQAPSFKKAIVFLKDGDTIEFI